MSFLSTVCLPCAGIATLILVHYQLWSDINRTCALVIMIYYMRVLEDLVHFCRVAFVYDANECVKGSYDDPDVACHAHIQVFPCLAPALYRYLQLDCPAWLPGSAGLKIACLSLCQPVCVGDWMSGVNLAGAKRLERVRLPCWLNSCNQCSHYKSYAPLDLHRHSRWRYSSIPSFHTSATMCSWQCTCQLSVIFTLLINPYCGCVEGDPCSWI